MRAILVAILLVAGSFVACAGDGVSEEDHLRDTAIEAFQTYVDGDNAKLYTFSSSELRDKCPFGDFVTQVMATRAVLGDISGAEAVIDDIRIEGSRGFVDSHLELDGVEIVSSEEDERHFADYWILEDGEWKSMRDGPAPCAEHGDEE
jgi:hypothetical protein